MADAWLAEAEEKKKAKVEPSGAAGGKRKKASKGDGSTGALEKEKRKTEGGGRFPKNVPTLSMLSALRRRHRPFFAARGIPRTRVRGRAVTA